MSARQAPRQIKINLSEALYERLSREAQRRAQDVSTVVEAVLEEYTQQFDLTQTRTWELCGSLAVSEPEPEYLVDSDEAEAPVTNYAERVDDVLYKGA
jgi:metal-responsive CopG/Arc/MetJ family transcriptional regulator